MTTKFTFLFTPRHLQLYILAKNNGFVLHRMTRKLVECGEMVSIARCKTLMLEVMRSPPESHAGEDLSSKAFWF